MRLINTTRWLLETNIPEQDSKRIFNEKEGREEIVPDGPRKDIWYWFMGTRSQMIGGVIAHFTVATPYVSQAVRYKEKDDALWVWENILKKDAGWAVVSEKESHLHLGRDIIIPVLPDNPTFDVDTKTNR